MTTTIDDIRELPTGRAPAPVPLPHFPDRLHAVVWRNWDVIDISVLAEVVRGTPSQITAIATSMGLPPQRHIPSGERQRNYMTILRRNWHLLPYDQLCRLLDWDAAAMRYALNEDDFMWVKLGGYKPRCLPVYYRTPDAVTRIHAQSIGQIVRDELGEALHVPTEPLFGFINRFNQTTAKPIAPDDGKTHIRMVYPYFLRYGDPLIGKGIDDIPEGYLAELAANGVNAVWFQGILNRLAPWELAPELSNGWQERLANLNRLVERCRRLGIDVILYLNEPRAMPKSFFELHPELRGVDEAPDRAPYSPDVTALCTSTQPVQEFLVNSVRHVFEQVPGLGGVFTITYSENLTNCYSRKYEKNAVDEFAIRTREGPVAYDSQKQEPMACPRCQPRGPETVNAEVCQLIERGMRLAGSEGKFLLYAWSTPDEWLAKIIDQLPDSCWLLCISEWGVPFIRGDYAGKVNEYSMSVFGPSDPCRRQWDLARGRGLKTAAKIQAANTWELSSLPYIPALRLVAQHLSNLAGAGVDGLMLGWTLGGSPSPNLELAAEFARSPPPSVHDAMLSVARRRYGAAAAGGVVQAWDLFSEAFSEFPFDLNVCYYSPQSLGPANLLFAEKTGYVATMCTFPFDDLDGWRGPYSSDTFLRQFEKLVDLWQRGIDVLDDLRRSYPSAALEDEWRIAEAAGIHFRSTAAQIRFIQVRQSDRATATSVLLEEKALARRLFDLVGQDSRIGFEATNQYAYLALDLVEKILNCEHLLTLYRDEEKECQGRHDAGADIGHLADKKNGAVDGTP